jgi:hypothetical protein
LALAGGEPRSDRAEGLGFLESGAKRRIKKVRTGLLGVEHLRADQGAEREGGAVEAVVARPF